MCKTTVILAILISAIVSPAYANGDTCERLQDGVWSCPIPTGPQAAPKCHIYGENLICDKAPVFSEPVQKPPENCGWNRKYGKYMCW